PGAARAPRRNRPPLRECPVPTGWLTHPRRTPCHLPYFLEHAKAGKPDRQNIPFTRFPGGNPTNHAEMSMSSPPGTPFRWRCPRGLFCRLVPGPTPASRKSVSGFREKGAQVYREDWRSDSAPLPPGGVTSISCTATAPDSPSHLLLPLCFPGQPSPGDLLSWLPVWNILASPSRSPGDGFPGPGEPGRAVRRAQCGERPPPATLLFIA